MDGWMYVHAYVRMYVCVRICIYVQLCTYSFCTCVCAIERLNVSMYVPNRPANPKKLCIPLLEKRDFSTLKLNRKIDLHLIRRESYFF